MKQATPDQIDVFERAHARMWAVPLAFSSRIVFRRFAAAPAILALCLTMGCNRPGTDSQTLNHPPTIVNVSASSTTLEPGAELSLEVFATDQDQDVLAFRWTATAGTFGDANSAGTSWTAPVNAGDADLTCTVTDENGASASLTLAVQVVKDNDDWDGDGYSVADGDCNDRDSSTYPQATELADGRDNDCDNTVDEGFGLYDEDGDGYPVHEGDCDDTDPDVYPGGSEVVDGLDNDCDGKIDEGSGASDDDRDGYAEAAGDCDDARPTVYPGAVEVSDGLDNDCDGMVDEGTTLVDDDGDGWTELGGDCDDVRPDVHPGAPEIVDGLDNDCDGWIDEGTDYQDLDQDGVTAGELDCDDLDPSVYPSAMEVADGIDNNCNGVVDDGTSVYDDDGDGLAESSGDCDDADTTVYPFATEVPDGLDNDCDGIVDEGTAAFDDDGDGYTERAGDCDDQDPRARPGYPEVPDGLDNDCDGLVDEGTVLADADDDSFSPWDGDCDDGDPDTYPGAIDLPEDDIVNDCSDAVLNQSPTTVVSVAGANAWCTAFFFDGSGSRDPEGAPLSYLWYQIDGPADASLDNATQPTSTFNFTSEGRYRIGLAVSDGTFTGWEDIFELDTTRLRQQVCEVDGDGDGLTALDGDCDDGNAAIYPGALEVCDGIDQDCDGKEILFEESFDSFDPASWRLEGAAGPEVGGILLTPATRNLSGSLFYQVPLTLDHFAFRFEIQIEGGSSGNGISAAIVDAEDPVFLGEGGGGNGLLGLQGWAVEFDNNDDAGYDDAVVPYSDHIALVRAEDLEPAFVYPSPYNRDYIIRGEIRFDAGTITFIRNDAELFSVAPDWELPALGYVGFTASTGTSTDRHHVLQASFECL